MAEDTASEHEYSGRKGRLYTARANAADDLRDFLKRYQDDLSYNEGKPIQDVADDVEPKIGALDTDDHFEILTEAHSDLQDVLNSLGDDLTFRQGNDLRGIADGMMVSSDGGE